MTTEEVAKRIVELTRKQAWREAVDSLYADDVVSVEAMTRDGSSPEMRGIEAVRGKVDWWNETMEVHRWESSEPFVAHDRFAVQYEADFTDREAKVRRQITEVGIYTVKNGKIIREEFLPQLRAD